MRDGLYPFWLTQGLLLYEGGQLVTQQDFPFHFNGKIIRVQRFGMKPLCLEAILGLLSDVH